MTLDYLVKLFHTKNKDTGFLKQGKLFSKNKAIFSKNKVIEGNIGSRNQEQSSGVEQEFENLKINFNNTLELYSKLYTEFLNSKMNQNTGLVYAGQIIQSEDGGAMYFVTEDGILKDFTKSTNIKNSNDECPKFADNGRIKVNKIPNQTLKDLLNNPKTLKSSHKISGVNSMCWSGGHNISYKEGSTTQYAYLDQFGTKHIYLNPAPENERMLNSSTIHISCPKELNKIYSEVSKEVWDSFPTATSKLTRSDSCMPSSKNVATETTLVSLNDELIRYANQMNDIVDRQYKNSGNESERSAEWGNIVVSKSNTLKQQREELEKKRRQVNELLGTYNEQKKNVKAFNLHNAVWGSALVLLLIIIGMRIMKK